MIEIFLITLFAVIVIIGTYAGIASGETWKNATIYIGLAVLTFFAADGVVVLITMVAAFASIVVAMQFAE